MQSDGLHPADIQAELKKKGITQVMVAKALGVHPTTVGRVIQGKETSDRIMRFVAKAIKRDLHEVFPKHYTKQIKRAEGERIVAQLLAANDG
jgi:lambda repressor-like predicted transcriptional regulator